MKLNKNKLLWALETVKPGLANKEIIQQATSFAFIEGIVITYNDEISISCEVPELKDITCAVQSDKLYKFLGKIKGDEDGNIDLEMRDNEIVVVSGRSKAGLSTQSEIVLPITEEDFLKRDKWHELPESFNEFLAMSSNACSRDMSNPILTAVHINENGIIEGCDNFRFIKCTLPEDFPFNTFLLPATSAFEVAKIKPTMLAEGMGWVHFKNEDEVMISCRIMADKYPDTSPLYKNKGERLILPRSTEEILDRAMIFSKEEHTLDESIDVIIANRSLKIKAQAGNSWFEEDANMNYKGKDIQFSITPYLLRNIIKETLECEIGDRTLSFQGENWQYVTLLRG